MQTYTHYKDSGIDWIGPIPEHWDLIKLKHIFREKPKTLNPTLSAGSISFGKVIYKNDEKIPESTKASYQEVLAGDFLINPLNLNYDLISLRIALSTINVVVSSGYIVLQNIIHLNKVFYKWFLHQYDVSYMKLLGSGVRQTINFNHIANSLLVFPPIQEQEAIANFLDNKTAKIDALVQTKEQQIEKQKELRQAKIHQAVTKGLDASAPTKDSGVTWIGEIPAHWEVKRLKLISNIFRGKFTHRPRNDERLYNGKYPFFQTGDVAKAGKYLFKYKQTLNEKGLEVSSLFPRGTRVITIAANIGDISILNIDGCFPDSIVGFKPSKEIIRYFLYNSLVNMKEVFINSSIKNTQMNLNIERIGNNFISIPPIQEQEQIVAYLDEVTGKIDQAITQKQEQITKLKAYKQSLINDVVTGKVKVC